MATTLMNLARFICNLWGGPEMRSDWRGGANGRRTAHQFRPRGAPLDNRGGFQVQRIDEVEIPDRSQAICAPGERTGCALSLRCCRQAHISSVTANGCGKGFIPAMEVQGSGTGGDFVSCGEWPGGGSDSAAGVLESERTGHLAAHHRGLVRCTRQSQLGEDMSFAW